jgi:hypothetical protein
LITSKKKKNKCSLCHFYKFDEKRERTPRWVKNLEKILSIIIIHVITIFLDIVLINFITIVNI